MFHGHHIMNTTFAVLKPMAVAAHHAVASLVLASLATSASAAMFTFDGQVDAGELSGSSVTGSFAVSGDASGALSDFKLTFLERTYTLASPGFITGAAWFKDGAFTGFEYVLQSDQGSPDQFVALTSGTPPDLDPAWSGFITPWFQGTFTFVRGVTSDQFETSWGSFVVNASAVPEPNILGLLLAGGVAAACVARPRRQA